MGFGLPNPLADEVPVHEANIRLCWEGKDVNGLCAGS